MSIFYSENLSSRTVLPASGITDNLLSFDVSNSGIEKRLTLDELKKTGVQVINVKQYGADSTGISSSTTSFSTAIDAVLAISGVLYIPPGSYTLTGWSQKTINSALTIIGDSKDATTITGPSPLVSMFLMNEGASLFIAKVGFTNFDNIVYVNANPTIDHETLIIDSCKFNDCTRPIQDSGGTVVNGFKEFRFINSTVINGDDGIRLRANSLRFAEISNNIVDTITNAAGCTGISILANSGNTTNCECAIINNNKVRDIISSGSGVETHGIMAQGRAIQITNNRIENVNNADATADEGLYTKSQNAIILGNILINAGAGEGSMTIKGEHKTTVSPPSPYGNAQIVSSNQIIETSSDDVILMYVHMEDSTVVGNVLQGGSRGIIVGGASNVVVTGNNITDGGSSGSGAAGILLHDCSGATVVGNTIKNWQQYGIMVRSSTNFAWGNHLIQNNHIEDINNAGYGIYNFCTYTLTNVVIANNFIQDVVTGGVLFSEAGLTGSTFTVKDNVMVNVSTAIGNTGAATVLRSGNIVDGVRTTTITGATPTRSATDVMKTNNGSPTTMTAINGGVSGDTVTVIIGDANTTIDFTGTTLKGNGGVDWTPGSGDHMICTFDGTNWYCNISEN